VIERPAGARSPTSRKLQRFGTTIFAEMTGLALEHDAINLSQGFPDFEGPGDIVDAAERALRAGENQYARSMGMPRLSQAIAAHQKRCYDLDVDPLHGVMVCTGATEAIAATMLGVLDPGDEVVLFEPFYDSYPACAALAGATPRYVTLRFPDFALDVDELKAAFNERTRLLVLNTPNNPTGKVFTRDELEAIAALCREHDVLVLADEVYEHLTFDDAEHVPIATLPGMFERTLTASSTGKTYSFTGWKVGWVTGAPEVVAAAQAAHQFLTYAGARPLQLAMADALERHGDEFFASLQREYAARRDFLVRALTEAGFEVASPQGTYFVLAGFSRLSDEDDRTFAQRLVREAGVAAIPPSAFYEHNKAEGQRLLRFAFCKQLPTLEAAAERLRRWAS
jgi:N-succinyldiaminopimelate aminotransferase